MMRPPGGLKAPEDLSFAGTRTAPYPPMDPPPTRFTRDRVIRFILWAGAVALAAWLLWFFSTLVIFLVAGGLLAYLMRPIVDQWQSLGLRRIPAILVTFVLVFGALTVVLTSLAPFVARQVTDLSQQVSVDVIADMVDQVEAYLARVFPIQEASFRNSVIGVFDTLFQEDRLRSLVGSMVDLFTNLFYAVLVIPFVTFFLLKDGPKIRHAVLGLVPNRYFEVTLYIAGKVETTLGRYFRALLVQSISIATMATVLLSLVGLDYPIVVGVFTGLANTIPYFGPLMGFLAGTLVGIAQTGDLSMVPGVLIAMGLTQVADNVFFQPYIFSRAAQAHPLVILFVVLIGAQLAGIVGMLLAIPLTTMVRVVIREVLWSLRNYRILRAA